MRSYSNVSYPPRIVASSFAACEVCWAGRQTGRAYSDSVFIASVHGRLRHTTTLLPTVSLLDCDVEAAMDEWGLHFQPAAIMPPEELRAGPEQWEGPLFLLAAVNCSPPPPTRRNGHVFWSLGYPMLASRSTRCLRRFWAPTSMTSRLCRRCSPFGLLQDRIPKTWGRRNDNCCGPELYRDLSFPPFY